MKRRTKNGFKLFNIITWLMIGIMFYYVGSKFVSLVITGETRQILIIEAKEIATKKVRAIVCNEILTSDRYLTEDRLIELTKVQQNRKKLSSNDKEIDKFVVDLGTYKESLQERLVKLKKNLDNINILSNEEKKEAENKRGKNNDDKIKKQLLDDRGKDNKKSLKSNLDIINNLNKKGDTKYLLNKFYTVDGQTSIDKNIFNPKKLININNKIKKDKTKPQILIYHTHSTEGNVDSTKGKREDTVVGVGHYLSENFVKD